MMIQRHKNFPYHELSVEERILLVEEIWDSIAAEQEHVPLTKAHRELVEERTKAYEANPESVLSWEQLKASIRERLDEFRARQ